MDNRTLLSKAAVDTSVLTGGGKMNPEQQTAFMKFMRDYSPFLKFINFIRMSKTTRNLDSIEVNQRSMRTQLENQDNPETGEASTKQRQLKAEGVIMPYNITFQFMKENIEQTRINATLARMFAQQFANDTVDLAWNGDTSKSDPFLSINDGFLKIALSDPETHKVDTEGSKDYIDTVFPALLDSVPGKYYQMYQKEDKNLLTIFCSHKDNTGYKRQMRQRHTGLGDQMLLSGKHVDFEGHEIYPVGFIPQGYYVVSPAKNLAFGVFGESLETYHQVVPRKTRHEYTLLGDFDMELVNPDVVVVGKDFS